MLYKTLKLRIKDKHASWLTELAKEVNFVWNYVNNLSYEHTKRTGKFFSQYDLAPYTKGVTKAKLDENTAGLRLHSQTVQAINEQYAIRRKQFKKVKLSWRVSNPKSSRRSLGWIPFKAIGIKIAHGQIKYGDKWLSLWDSYNIAQYQPTMGSFVQDNRNRWYVCLVVKVKEPEKQINKENVKEVGIDLGLTTFATLSNGTKLETKNNYRKLEEKLGMAQRAKKANQVKVISAKIKNSRKDELHKLSSKLVKEFNRIYIGDVSSSKLAKTRLAKSVLDKGWTIFRTMLEYKCKYAGKDFKIVSERLTSQTCSRCGDKKPQGSPKGIAGLGIREWQCACGTIHDRDVNAANNILAVGRGSLAEGIPSL